MCGGLHKNSLVSEYLSQVGESVWEGGVALLEDICHWEWAWRFQQPVLFLISVFFLSSKCQPTYCSLPTMMVTLSAATSRE